MDDRDTWIGLGTLVVAFLLLMGSAYGTYRYGRMAERRLLYAALASSVAATYDEGLNDGVKEGKSQGYKQGWKEALKNCSEEPEEDGRY